MHPCIQRDGGCEPTEDSLYKCVEIYIKHIQPKYKEAADKAVGARRECFTTTAMCVGGKAMSMSGSERASAILHPALDKWWGTERESRPL